MCVCMCVDGESYIRNSFKIFGRLNCMRFQNKSVCILENIHSLVRFNYFDNSNNEIVQGNILKLIN